MKMYLLILQKDVVKVLAPSEFTNEHKHVTSWSKTNGRAKLGYVLTSITVSFTMKVSLTGVRYFLQFMKILEAPFFRSPLQGTRL
jgi:hypothetical protein